MANIKKYHGGYSADEYAIVKKHMLTKHPEIGTHFLDEMLRFISKRKWPQKRKEVYTLAKASGVDEHGRLVLRLYDEAQMFFDEVHHGTGYIRFFEEYEGIPESRVEIPHSLAVKAVVSGAYVGIPPLEIQEAAKAAKGV